MRTRKQRGGGRVKELMESAKYGGVMKAIMDDNVDGIKAFFAQNPKYDVNAPLEIPGYPKYTNLELDIKNPEYEYLLRENGPNAKMYMRQNSALFVSGKHYMLQKPLIAYTLAQGTSGFFKSRECVFKPNAYRYLKALDAKILPVSDVHDMKVKYNNTPFNKSQYNEYYWTPGQDQFMAGCSYSQKQKLLNDRGASAEDPRPRSNSNMSTASNPGMGGYRHRKTRRRKTKHMRR